MTRRARPLRTARQFALELAFAQTSRQLPPVARPRLLAWLRRFRRRPARTFYLLDPTTGHWRRL
jgi:hypothetical protein